jgi:hypothetical protein
MRERGASLALPEDKREALLLEIKEVEKRVVKERYGAHFSL